MSKLTVGVVGSGTMGGAIAHLAALSGFSVIVRDVQDAFLQKAKERMETFMEKSISRGKMTAEQAAEVLERVTFTTESRRLERCRSRH